MLINTATDQCLASPADQGDQIRTLPCNTYDQTQWWVETR
jgi:hypothetical protein